VDGFGNRGRVGDGRDPGPFYPGCSLFLCKAMGVRKFHPSDSRSSRDEVLRGKQVNNTQLEVNACCLGTISVVA